MFYSRVSSADLLERALALAIFDTILDVGTDIIDYRTSHLSYLESTYCAASEDLPWRISILKYVHSHYCLCTCFWIEVSRHLRRSLAISVAAD